MEPGDQEHIILSDDDYELAKVKIEIVALKNNTAAFQILEVDHVLSGLTKSGKFRSKAELESVMLTTKLQDLELMKTKGETETKTKRTWS